MTVSYLDWGRYSAPSANVIDSKQNIGAVGTYNGPNNDCSPWSDIMVTFLNFDASVSALVNIGWSGYAGSVQPDRADAAIVGPGQTAFWTVPTIDRTVNIQYTGIGADFTGTTKYDIHGLSRPISKYGASTVKTTLLSTVVTLASQQISTFDLTRWYEGSALVSVGSASGQTSTLIMESVDLNNRVFTEYARMGALASTSGTPVIMPIPPAPTRVKMFNGGGVSETYAIDVMPIETGR